MQFFFESTQKSATKFSTKISILNQFNADKMKIGLNNCRKNNKTYMNNEIFVRLKSALSKHDL